MPVHVTVETLQAAIDAAQATGGNAAQAARLLNIPESTLKLRLGIAKRRGLVPKAPHADAPLQLKAQIKRLQSDLRDAQQERVDHAMIKHKIIGLTREVNDVTPPNWMKLRDVSHSRPGVPTLLVSDLHWGEVVDPKQINGVNEYNLEIARNRMKRLAERTVRLLEIISPKLDYPGIVLPLGGDSISGSIHEELLASDELKSIPAMLDLYGVLVWFIKYMLSYFPAVFIPAVTGNHGRSTKKIWIKGRHHTSFDWLLSCLLAKHFEDDKRVTFLIPDGPDAHYQIYNHIYLLTHGDQFSGGDGVIGPLGPLCVSPDTKILMTDLSYRPAADLQVGDELIGFDEEAKSGGRRTFCNSTVLETRQLQLECYEIHTEDGQRTIASIDHPWLCLSGASHAWIKSRHLRIGSEILTLGPPWEVETTYEAGYLAGLLDGEGSLEDSGRLKFTQQKNHCLERTLAILDKRGIPYRLRENGAEAKGYEPCYGVMLFNGRVDALRDKLRADTWRLLGEIRPERIIHEQAERTWVGVSTQVAKRTRVIGIRYIGLHDVAAFSTSSKTFIGNGMLMHNTRGDHRKRTRNSQINMAYDTMICGHWHQYIHLNRLIVNSSVKGYDEYAYSNNFPYEPAQQALWITHPKYRITYRAPVIVQDLKERKEQPWVSIAV